MWPFLCCLQFGEHTDPELNASDKLTRSNKAQQWVQRQQLAKGSIYSVGVCSTYSVHT